MKTWHLIITLAPEGVPPEVETKLFRVQGDSGQDLAMLGAAKGWLEGLYKEAEGPAIGAGMIGPMKELYADMNKPRPYPPMPAELVAPEGEAP